MSCSYTTFFSYFESTKNCESWTTAKPDAYQKFLPFTSILALYSISCLLLHFLSSTPFFVFHSKQKTALGFSVGFLLYLFSLLIRAVIEPHLCSVQDPCFICGCPVHAGLGCVSLYGLWPFVPSSPRWNSFRSVVTKSGSMELPHMIYSGPTCTLTH